MKRHLGSVAAYSGVRNFGRPNSFVVSSNDDNYKYKRFLGKLWSTSFVYIDPLFACLHIDEGWRWYFCNHGGSRLRQLCVCSENFITTKKFFVCGYEKYRLSSKRWMVPPSVPWICSNRAVIPETTYWLCCPHWLAPIWENPRAGWPVLLKEYNNSTHRVKNSIKPWCDKCSHLRLLITSLIN